MGEVGRRMVLAGLLLASLAVLLLSVSAGVGPAHAQSGRPPVEDPRERGDVPPLLLDPRPDAHARSGKPEWSIDPAHSIQWVIVVRHAEKASAPEEDPPLSEQGEARATLLERMLRDASPTLLLGTELIRTQRTLEPLAAELGLLVDIHESDDPYGMAARVREFDRPVSVVAAHGDTVVPILEALTGLDLENLHPIGYDDFFVVAIAPGVTDGSGRSAASVLRMKYGPES